MAQDVTNGQALGNRTTRTGSSQAEVWEPASRAQLASAR